MVKMFFFAFPTKKGRKHKNLHQNIQSTGHWPKSFGPVVISRLRGCGTMPYACSCGVPLVVHIHNLRTQFRLRKEHPILGCGPSSNINGPCNMCPSPCGSRVAACPAHDA